MITVINDTKWIQLTPHQSIRHFELSVDSTLLDIEMFVSKVNLPFDKNQVTWSITNQNPFVLKVHSMKVLTNK